MPENTAIIEFEFERLKSSRNLFSNSIRKRYNNYDILYHKSLSKAIWRFLYSLFFSATPTKTKLL